MRPPCTVQLYSVYRLSDASGEMVFKQEKEGEVLQSDLDTNVSKLRFLRVILAEKLDCRCPFSSIN